jgi:hypothetical protein
VSHQRPFFGYAKAMLCQVEPGCIDFVNPASETKKSGRTSQLKSPGHMPRREALPQDLKQLCCLCRGGKLFAVQNWIRAGRRYRLPEGHFTTSPLRISIQSGFHSLVEVLLTAGVSQKEKNEALLRAVSDRNLDIIELLREYGADVSSIDPEEVFWSRDPAIIRWFIANGMDLEGHESIAKAFRDKQREFLGIYMNLRDQIPSARKQAAMALPASRRGRESKMGFTTSLGWCRSPASSAAY